jgi:hypothetical protein
VGNLLAIVPAPAYEPSPYGILSLPGDIMQGDLEGPSDDHWIGGFTYESRLCSTTVNLLDVCGGPAPVRVMTASQPVSSRNRDYSPFIVEVEEPCSTFGFEARRVQERATLALEAATQKAVEFEFWTGSMAKQNGYSNRYLAGPEAQDITPGGAPVKVRYGLALLEQALADCGIGTRGVIHTPHSVASAVLPMRENSGHLETPLGNYVVAGSGYPGTGPDGTLPSAGTWMYATGMVQVRLGPPEMVGVNNTQITNSANNTMMARAQRAAAATWDGCCTFAVHVDLTLDYQ